MSPIDLKPRQIVYPEDNGEPLAENTLQFEWIVTIKENLSNLYRDEPKVFVAGDLLWYPVEGNNTLCQAPDAMVAIGRPRGYRGSYRQWEEDGVAPQVVFEVLSPGNRAGKMLQKLRFYEKYGVDEYYVYDPDDNELDVWIRQGSQLEQLEEVKNWVSPKLGIRFDLQADQLVIYRPDGEKFVSFEELCRERDEVKKLMCDATQLVEEERGARMQAQSRADIAQQKTLEAQQKALEAQQKTLEAQQKTLEAQQKTLETQQRADALAAKLRELGVDPAAV